MFSAALLGTALASQHPPDTALLTGQHIGHRGLLLELEPGAKSRRWKKPERKSEGFPSLTKRLLFISSFSPSPGRPLGTTTCRASPLQTVPFVGPQVPTARPARTAGSAPWETPAPLPTRSPPLINCVFCPFVVRARRLEHAAVRPARSSHLQHPPWKKASQLRSPGTGGTRTRSFITRSPGKEAWQGRGGRQPQEANFKDTVRVAVVVSAA